MTLALVSAELLTVIAMLALLIGVPLFVVAVIAVVSAYLQYDAEQYLEELEAKGETGEAPADEDGPR
ncbi:hypothetical protein [Natronolimnohabitans innermongolicus]|uniref:Uncharacterized protein n=1 Tax=Natronolimnohabitans innermongolicus JCM 12255 TaxID=1227499 RepID=L9WNY3_9EURY|nr:hypothetical protein [Natronolimnohabitans innermongolicus]ELY51174.1 hypothetical protein C493_17721 [Natronolimnohabitans innermongolicus JCM 12255]